MKVAETAFIKASFSLFLRMCEVLVEDIGKVDGLRAEGEGLVSGVISCRVVLGRQPLVVPVLSRTIHNR